MKCFLSLQAIIALFSGGYDQGKVSNNVFLIVLFLAAYLIVFCACCCILYSKKVFIFFVITQVEAEMKQMEG